MNITQYDIIFSVVTAVSLFFLLASFVIAFALKFQKRRQEHIREMSQVKHSFDQALLSSQIEVQESTLSTLSKELHDNIGQLLSSAKMLLGITERTIVNPPDTLKTASETVSKAINELRSLSKSLSREWLEQFDLLQNLNTEVNRLNSADGVTLGLSHPDELLLEADEQIILFRIIQEAVQNAIKHSAATNIFITILMQNDTLITSVKDNGKGFDDKERPDGVGILNMKHRTKLLGGTIEWLNNGEGCVVTILLPVKKDKL